MTSLNLLIGNVLEDGYGVVLQTLYTAAIGSGDSDRFSRGSAQILPEDFLLFCQPQIEALQFIGQAAFGKSPADKLSARPSHISPQFRLKQQILDCVCNHPRITGDKDAIIESFPTVFFAGPFRP